MPQPASLPWQRATELRDSAATAAWPPVPQLHIVLPALLWDASGSLYIGDAFNRRVREVSSGVIRTVAGGGTGGDGGPATSAGLNVYCVALDASGDFYIEV